MDNKNGFINTEFFDLIKDKEPILFTYNNGKIEANYKLSKEYTLYEGVVSCIEVPSSYIMIRQNGNTFITGNCPRPFVSLSEDKDSTLNDRRWEEFKQMVSEYM